MFSLIISIIAIALVAALAAASVYYGGSAFNKGTAGADASTFVNNGQQINGAWTLALTDGLSPATVADLAPDYLSQIPTYKGTQFKLSTENDDYVVLKDADDNIVQVATQVCTEIVARGGDTATVALTDALFGCNAGVAYYKVK